MSARVVVARMSRRAIIAQLNIEIRMWQFSYRGSDGVIRDKKARRAIAALQQAVEIVKKGSK